MVMRGAGCQCQHKSPGWETRSTNRPDVATYKAEAVYKGETSSMTTITQGGVAILHSHIMAVLWRLGQKITRMARKTEFHG